MGRRDKAIKTREAEGEFSPLEIHWGRVFDSSSSAGESKRDPACQKEKKRKPKQMREKRKEMKREEKSSFEEGG